MKIITRIFILLLSGILYVSVSTCKKETPKTIPAATIGALTNITATSVSAAGDITSDGGATITARGVCWSINQNPNTSDNKIIVSGGTGGFSSLISGLTPGTLYYLRVYATNAVGIGYSKQSTFTTLALVPVLTTTELSGVTPTSALGGGNISNDGGSPVTQRGVCWSKAPNPTTSDSLTKDATGTGIFISNIKDLSPGTTYYFRAYATNSIGTAYGNQYEFKTYNFGIVAKYYILSGNLVMPDYSTLVSYSTEVVSVKILNYTSSPGNFAGSGLEDNVGAVFEGLINIQTQGLWTFFTESDDGSALYIDDQLVVDNKNLQQMNEKSGSISLTEGNHKIRVEYFENSGNAGLIVSWQSTGTLKQVIPSFKYFY